MAVLNSTIVGGKLTVNGAISQNGALLSDTYAAKSHTHSQYLTAHQGVSNKNATLTWGGAVTVATIGSTDIKVSLPANPNTDHYAWSDITGKPTSFTPASHTHSSIVDAGNNSSSTTFAYSKAGLAYADYTWLAGWNGYELRAVNKSQFATASHTHSYAGSSSAGGAATSADSVKIGSTYYTLSFSDGELTFTAV